MTDSLRPLMEEIIEGAKKATPGPWETDDPVIVMARPDGFVTYLAKTFELDVDYEPSADNAAYIARLDPATITAICTLAMRAEELEAALRQAERDRNSFRECLSQIENLVGKTLISTEHGTPYSLGANAAFEQAADMAHTALRRTALQSIKPRETI